MVPPCTDSCSGRSVAEHWKRGTTDGYFDATGVGHIDGACRQAAQGVRACSQLAACHRNEEETSHKMRAEEQDKGEHRERELVALTSPAFGRSTMCCMPHVAGELQATCSEDGQPPSAGSSPVPLSPAEKSVSPTCFTPVRPRPHDTPDRSA